MDDSLDRALVTKEQASAAVELCFGEPLPNGTFRQWKSRGRIYPATPGGGLYFLSDVLALAAVRAKHKLEVAAKPKPPPKPRVGPPKPTRPNLDDYVRMCRPCHRQMDARHARDVEFRRNG